MKKWWPLVALATAQFVMVLDQSVMNVSISTLVDDFDTTVTTIQAVITLYCLTMAMFMLTGGKIGDIIGRRKAFVVGLAIYACGSAITAVAPTVAVLTLGWSILEGLGAALVMPALVALIAGNYEGKDRNVAYAVIGGVAGAGIAIGPILGGWATTELSWRVVFVGEVILVLGILAMSRLIHDAARPTPIPRLDFVGTILSASGLGLIVLGVLQSSTWGWVKPIDSPIEPLGFSLTLFVIAFGGVLIWAFVSWQRHREAIGRDPLVHLSLLKIPPLRSGLYGLLSQNLILMGIFFTVPLYLQLVLGLDALETGIKMLPVSITMFIASALGARLASRFSVRAIVRSGLWITLAAVLVLLGTIEPTLDDSSFALSMALLGVGMGLLASQLGKVVQASVDVSGPRRGRRPAVHRAAARLIPRRRAHRGGGAVRPDEQLRHQHPGEPRDQPGGVGPGQHRRLAAASTSCRPTRSPPRPRRPASTRRRPTALVDDYEAAQLTALKAGLLGAALLALISLPFTRDLPSASEPAARKPEEEVADA